MDYRANGRAHPANVSTHVKPVSTSPTPGAQAIRETVARLASSSALRASPNLFAFLRYVVEKAVAGDTASIKAYSIGVDVLGQCMDFDPSSNAVVRVAALRLRRALARYYEGEGTADPVVIQIPRGSYVPRFAWREEDVSATAQIPSKPESLSLEHRLTRLLSIQGANEAGSAMRRYTRYLNCAVELRALAEEMRSPVAHDSLLSAADTCDRLAKSLLAIETSRLLLKS